MDVPPEPGERGTRLLLRTMGRTSPWWLTVGYVGLLVPADHVMATSMLTGIKRRVETAAGSGRDDHRGQQTGLDGSQKHIVADVRPPARPARRAEETSKPSINRDSDGCGPPRHA
ncbi:MAG TPA: hypothetical protein VF391_00910 [Dermatophilaceae bacterium]